MILRHAWQREAVEKHGRNAQVVLIWYLLFPDVSHSENR